VNSEVRLRDQARAHLQSGKLPNHCPRRVWGGPGAGLECAVCELPVSPEQVEMQVEFLRDHDVELPEVFHVHSRCFAAWELERTTGGSH
jgi:hypothetical protein